MPADSLRLGSAGGLASAPLKILLGSTGQLHHLYVAGRVDELECALIIDTGASQTIVHPRILERANYPAKLAPSNAFIQSVSGDTFPVCGTTEVLIEMGSFLVSHVVYVAEISDDCIIGIDFLAQYACTLDLAQGVLKIGDVVIPFGQQDPTRQAAKLYQAIHLPAGQEVPTELLVNVSDWQDVLITPPPSLPEDLQMLPTITTSQRGRVTVCIANLSDEEIVLPANTTLGILEIKPEIIHPRIVDSTSIISPGFHELFSRSVSNLTKEQQKQLWDTLVSYVDVFSHSKTDIGHTSILRHKIDPLNNHHGEFLCPEGQRLKPS